MKLYTYKENIDSNSKIGVSYEDGFLYPLNMFGINFSDMNEFILNITDSQLEILKNKPNSNEIAISDILCLAPIPYPIQDILCLGINYNEHHKEAGRFDKDAFGDRPNPIYFSKRVNQANYDGGIIPAYSSLVDSLDYEVELGVIIGKDAFNVSKADAYKYIFGYTIINDISARNLQTGHKQWYFGKSLDGFTPMGPCILTADEVSYPPKLNIRCSVNGELRQNSNTSALITDIGDIIEQLSQGMTLKAGTIIATGTPAGVGMGMNPPCFLKSGDVVVCEIEKIGTLTNVVK